MASVAISQIMSSDLDGEVEANRKILAFTNSVQDAAHQAGFFEARNYRFSFRNALQNALFMKFTSDSPSLDSSVNMEWLSTKISFKHSSGIGITPVPASKTAIFFSVAFI